MFGCEELGEELGKSMFGCEELGKSMFGCEELGCEELSIIVSDTSDCVVNIILLLFVVD